MKKVQLLNLAGTLPDRAVAKEVGCSREYVRRTREEAGIAAYRARCAPTGVDYDSEPLGVVSDAEIARKHGVTRQSVISARKRRGIESPTKRVKS